MMLLTICLEVNTASESLPQIALDVGYFVPSCLWLLAMKPDIRGLMLEIRYKLNYILCRQFLKRDLI